MDTRLQSTRDSRYAAPLDAPARLRRITIAVKGLYYEGSPIGLAHQLLANPGIVDVAVDTRAGIASITFDETPLSEDAVIHLISECGYELGQRDVAGVAAGAIAVSRAPRAGD